MGKGRKRQTGGAKVSGGRLQKSAPKSSFGAFGGGSALAIAAAAAKSREEAAMKATSRALGSEVPEGYGLLERVYAFALERVVD